MAIALPCHIHGKMLRYSLQVIQVSRNWQGVLLAISFEMRDLYMRSPILWLAFWLLLAFWFAAFYFHLRGGVTTYSLVVVGIALLLKRGRVGAR